MVKSVRSSSTVFRDTRANQPLLRKSKREKFLGDALAFLSRLSPTASVLRFQPLHDEGLPLEGRVSPLTAHVADDTVQGDE